MLSAGELLFGSSGESPSPFRGPGWENQGSLLNEYMLGQFISPELYQAQQGRVNELQRQIEAQGGNEETRRLLEHEQNQLRIMEGAKPFMNQNRFTAGMKLKGEIAPSTDKAFMGEMKNLQNLVGQDIPVNFTQRNPFKFSEFQFQDPTQGMTAQQMVGDAFTPQYQMAQRLAQREGDEQRRQIAEDMNKRGMLSSGMTTRAMQLQQRDQGDRLANLSSQLAAQQGQQMLGANQYLQGMGWQRQQAQQGANWQKQAAQAEEVFRQQGATDAQAQFLANMSLQQRQQQMAQQQARLAAQQQQFGQRLQGRQQGLNEWSTQYQSQRAPMEDLFRLYQLSTGGSPGQAPTPGLLQGLAGGVGLGLGELIAGACLPKGTIIETEDGGKKVEDITIGDEVRGGKVISTFRKMRTEGHRFFVHRFEDGKEVVMSNGHPFFERLTELPVPIEHDSAHTYDILTDEGYYYVNGVMLGSTLDARFCTRAFMFGEVGYGL
jgi:hypothetical protein